MEERAEGVHAGICRAAPRAGMDALPRSTQRPGPDTDRQRPARIRRVVKLKERAERAANNSDEFQFRRASVAPRSGRRYERVFLSRRRRERAADSRSDWIAVRNA